MRQSIDDLSARLEIYIFKLFNFHIWQNSQIAKKARDFSKKELIGGRQLRDWGFDVSVAPNSDSEPFSCPAC